MQTLLTERTHLFSPCIKVSVVIDIEGPLDHPKLEEAIIQAVKANEILSCVIDLDSDGNAGYRPTGKPLYALTLSQEPWDVLVSAAHRRPSNLEKGPLLECFAKQQEHGFLLTLIAHHLAGDGLSLTYLVQDILRSLNGECPACKPLRLLDPAMVGDANMLHPVMHFLLERQNRSWRKAAKVFTYADYQRLVESYWTDRQLHVASLQVQEQTLAKLQAYAKSRELTINTLLTTALLKVKTERTKVGLALSVRPAGYEAMGNFASGISIHYRYAALKSFEENARLVQKLIQGKSSNDDSKYFLLRFLQAIDPTLIDAAYFSAYDGYDHPLAKRMQSMFGYQGRPAQIGISNLGRLSIQEQYGQYRLMHFRFIPPLVPNNACIMGAATLGSCMELSLVGSEQTDLPLLEQIVQVLEDICLIDGRD